MRRGDVAILAAIVLTTVPCWVWYIDNDVGKVAADSYRQGWHWSEFTQATGAECDEHSWNLPRPEVNIVQWMDGCTDSADSRIPGPAPG
ncbi:MAG: hypothetical protein GEV09_17755 [Pseudonocardiaceae bacterium]|nr:hypothetical protein [Pseudonocardiaceae bacterium]